MKSIRFTTTWLTFAGVSLLGLALCSAAYLVARKILIDNFDRDLLLEFQNVASVARVWPDGDFYIDIDFDVATQYNSGGSRIFQVWSADGKEIVDQSPMLEEENRRLSYPPRPADKKPYFFDLQDKHPARAIFQKVDAQWGWIEEQPDLKVSEHVQGMEVQLLVARERTSLDQSLALLRNWMLAIAAILPALTFLIVYLTIGRGLKPLRELTTKVSAIRSSGEKLEADLHWPQEITPVAETLNALLKRLDFTLQRERRFTSDAAHELRTPLAELRIATDIALRAQQNQERLLTAVRHANHLSHSMANLVNSMLLLARFQSGSSKPENTPINVAALFDEQRQRIHALANKRGLTVQAEAPNTLIITSDKGLLTTIMANLFTNAVEYAPLESTVALSLSASACGFALETRNTAPDLTHEDLERLFHPFWRKGESRSQRDHYGLGLAIVQEAAACLALELDVALEKENVLRIRVSSRITETI
ncbi:ATP-binding protein [Hahella aquimaris]|uniref:ATP-binding protein n=1 Tax=Hahella sp. HNIBRBA332 TaxID=3015983 RepID=UPI00273CDCC4|nr:ATP-binding protein [Hahella sp. HNIBRBA332]WLQ11472.1 ATP-binding protein [Hahella sp. HNIBRBA332]